MTVTRYASADRSEWVAISGLPFSDGSGNEKKQRIRDGAGGSVTVKYASGEWLIAPAHFMAVATGLAARYGSVTLVQDRRINDKCTDHCQSANPDTAFECQCVCLGMEHGGGYAGWRWRQVDDYLLVAQDTVERTTQVLDGKSAEKLREKYV